MKNLVVIGTLLISLVGCTSKVSEGSLDSVDRKGMSLDERLSTKAKLDSRLEEIHKGAEKIKRVIEIFRKAQSQDAHQLLARVYTPVDMIIDINNLIKQSIPAEYQGRVQRRGKLDLPIEGLSEECKTIDTIFETDSTTMTVADTATYLVKTCATNNQYIAIAQAKWEDDSLNFNFMQENLAKVFGDIFKRELQKGSCRIDFDDEKVVNTITCSDMNVDLNKHEYAVIRELTYNSTQEVRFLVNADVFHSHSGERKAIIKLVVWATGDIKFDAKRVNE
jgi:hypothetical protein